MTDNALSTDPYQGLLQAFTERIAGAQTRAALAVNRELVLLYWQMGRDILTQQRQHGWGAKIIDQLARDLQHAFPNQKGFSPRNLKYMRAFAEAWSDEAFVQQAAAQIPWFHNCLILEKVHDSAQRMWYTHQTIEQGWSRDILAQQIASRLYERQGKALTNFTRTLPPERSDLARQLLKDPYNFDFLSLGVDAQERDIEQGLLSHIRAFLLELGIGFAFVGSQYRLSVADQDYYLDMLFYHLALRCYVVIDLKIGDFKPEDAGKMNFYLSAVDDQLRHVDDQPSIGIILCKDKSQVIVEYTLRDMHKPIGVAAYDLQHALPEQLQLSLPTIEELEAALNDPDVQADNTPAHT